MKPRSLSMTVLILGICSMALSEISIIGPIAGVVAIIMGIYGNKKICREKKDQNRTRLGMLAAFFGITTFAMILIMAGVAMRNGQ